MSEKKKWVAWLLMITFAPDNKKIMLLSSSANGPLDPHNIKARGQCYVKALEVEPS